MSGYFNVTNTVCGSLSDRLAILEKSDNCLEREVLARIGNFSLIPLSLLTGLADTVIGVGAGVAAIATCGMHLPTYEFANNHLKSSRFIIAHPYGSFLLAINAAEPSSFNENGFIAEHVYVFFENIEDEIWELDNELVVQVASRITYAVMAVALILSRVADAAISIFAVALSIITLGRIASINELAFCALQFPGIIQDIFYCTVRIINPSL